MVELTLVNFDYSRLKKSDNDKYWRGCGETSPVFSHTAGEDVNVAAALENSLAIL